MKMLSISCFFIIVSLALQAQVVEWKFYSKKLDNTRYEVHIAAEVKEPWHIYSQTTPKGGPLPTTFRFSKNPLLSFQGNVKEMGDMEKYHEKVFDVDVHAFTGEVDFIQVVKLKTKAKTKFSGTVEFMACTKEQCLTPQTVSFIVELKQ